MKMHILALLGAALIMLGGLASGYEVDTHVKLTKEGVAASQLQKDPAIVEALGIKVTDKFKNSEGTARTVQELVSDGADFEDDTATVKRPLNHFFDPTRNMPLTVLGITPGKTSPDWALEDKETIAEQQFSYQDAREYLYKALTFPDKQDRDRYFGLTFETLGRVIHHIQDMAQPQHVRNDQHLDKPKEFLGIIPNPFYSPSGYEKYTLDKYAPDNEGKSFPLPTGYDPVYSGTDTTTFDLPRKFWTTTAGNGNGGMGSRSTPTADFFPPVLTWGAGDTRCPRSIRRAWTQMSQPCVRRPRGRPARLACRAR